MAFRASFCDPFKPDIIELGEIESSAIIETFKKMNLPYYLDLMEKSEDADIHYSPSLEFENKDNKNGLAISILGESANPEYYIFFKRPKLVRKFWGLTEKMDDNYLSEVQGQTEQDAIDCLTALINNDLDFLEAKIK